ncbi:MAG: glycoside hydrolase family 3 N-terminal domain-containing protein [Bacteroidota bacterium]
MRIPFLIFFMCCLLVGKMATAQDPAAYQWATTIFRTLTEDERIAQLLVVRSSGMDAKGNAVVYDSRIDSLVSKYNIGAICAFQGTPLQHAAMFNRIQSIAKTPVMITTDAEWGLGMRFAGVKAFPFQLTMGAVPDAALVYNVGKAIGDQCRRMNIHVNYAPVVDINNNPDNPVIGVRSFGEDKYKVALMGTRIMEGMQEQGIMACAKHFPGHGDVSVDSHYDLPVINKSMQQLDSLELYPFQQLFQKGVGSVMVAHLYVPSIDSTVNQATSLSYKNITELMRSRLGYRGLTFTDALEMKGVTKFYPGGEAAVQSLVAGNDMLCLPESVPQSIEAVKKAIGEGRLTWMEVNNKCMRVLAAKYKYVFGKTSAIDTNNLVADLNKSVTDLRKQVAEKALTVLAIDDAIFPLKPVAKSTAHSQVVYIAFGSEGNNELAARLKKLYRADVIALPYNDSEAIRNFKLPALKKYQKIVIGLHGIGRSPARNFGVPAQVFDLVNEIQAKNKNAILLTFGNPYINKYFAASKNLVACYEDDAHFQGAAANWISGKVDAVGTLPVTVGIFPFGTGIVKKKPLIM